MPGIARHTPELTGNRAVRLIIADTALLPHIGELLGKLTLPYEWVEIGDSVDDIVDSSFVTLLDYLDNLMIGSVSSWLIAPPLGWLVLDGSTYDKADYPELWEVLPTQLKTVDDFTLPDMTSQFQSGTITEADIGDTAGANLFALTTGQLPAHTHTEIPALLGVDVGGAGPPLPSATVGSPIPSGSTGNGDDIDNRPEHVEFIFAVYSGRV